MDERTREEYWERIEHLTIEFLNQSRLNYRTALRNRESGVEEQSTTSAVKEAILYAQSANTLLSIAEPIVNRRYLSLLDNLRRDTREIISKINSLTNHCAHMQEASI